MDKLSYGRTVSKSILSAFFTIAVLLTLSTAADARSLTITEVIIEAEILPDGSMKVVESRTVDFDGQFNVLVQYYTFEGRTTFPTVRPEVFLQGPVLAAVFPVAGAAVQADEEGGFANLMEPYSSLACLFFIEKG